MDKILNQCRSLSNLSESNNAKVKPQKLKSNQKFKSHKHSKSFKTLNNPKDQSDDENEKVMKTLKQI